MQYIINTRPVRRHFSFSSMWRSSASFSFSTFFKGCKLLAVNNIGCADWHQFVFVEAQFNQEATPVMLWELHCIFWSLKYFFESLFKSSTVKSRLHWNTLIRYQIKVVKTPHLSSPKQKTSWLLTPAKPHSCFLSRQEVIISSLQKQIACYLSVLSKKEEIVAK